MKHACFRLQARPDRLSGYCEQHAAVWPEMMSALATARREYSQRPGDDGLLIGHFETVSLHTARTGMAASEVNARWKAEGTMFFLRMDGAPDIGFDRLPGIFHPDGQMAGTRVGPVDRSGSALVLFAESFQPPPAREGGRR